MKVDVTTKFNLGDTVYYKDYYYDICAIQGPCIISEIHVIMQNNKSLIMYTIKDKNIDVSYPEHLLFHTYEECKCE